MIDERWRWLLILLSAALFFALNLAVSVAFAQSVDSCAQGTDGNWYKYQTSGVGMPFIGDVGLHPNRGSWRTAAEGPMIASKCGSNPTDSHGLQFCRPTCAVTTFYATGGIATSSVSIRWDGKGTINGVNCGTLGAQMTACGDCGTRVLQSDPATQCPADPPPEVECNLPQDPELGIANFWPVAEEGDNIACDVGTNCLVAKRPGTTVCGPVTCGAIYSYTEGDSNGGTACDGATVPEDNTPPELADPEGPPAPAERCNTIGEAEYCVNTGDEEGNDSQCGYLNDKFICVTATPDNGCQAVSGGGMLCDPDATAPPAPDNGTPGTPATPDGQVEASAAGGNTTNTYNYYDNDTVNNSAGPVHTGHTDTGNDQNGDGFTDGDEEEGPTGSAGGGESCTAPPTCDGDAIACAALAQAWRQRCPEVTPYSELREALGISDLEEEDFATASGGGEVDIGTLDASGFWSAGACPSALNISIHGQSMNLDIWGPACSMATLFAPFVLAMAYLMAAYIFIGRGW